MSSLDFSPVLLEDADLETPDGFRLTRRTKTLLSSGRITTAGLRAIMMANRNEAKELFDREFPTMSGQHKLIQMEIDAFNDTSYQNDARNIVDSFYAYCIARGMHKNPQVAKSRLDTYKYYLRHETRRELKGKLLKIFQVLTSDTREQFSSVPVLCQGKMQKFLASHLRTMAFDKPGRRLKAAQGLMSINRTRDVSDSLSTFTSLRRHGQLLCSEPNRNELTEEKFLGKLDLVVDEIFKPDSIRFGDQTAVPMRSCIGSSRSEGAFRCLVRRYYGLTAQMTDRFSHFENYRDRIREIRAPNVGPVDLFEDFYEELMDWTIPDVEAVVIHDKGKNRIVTKNDPRSSFLMLPLQDYMFRSIQKHPTFFFTCHTTEEGRSVFDRVLNYDWIQNSGDFESATDLFCPSWSKRVVERICRRLRLPIDYMGAAIRSVGEVNLSSSISKSTRTSVGQMMGNPLSFPILCAVNAAIYLTACEVSDRKFLVNKKLRDLPVLINGDDIVSSVPEGFWVLDWINVVKDLGLKVSTSKTGVSREWFSLNSRVFSYTPSGCTQLYAPLCSLLIGNRNPIDRVTVNSYSEMSISRGEPLRKRLAEISDEVNYSVFGVRKHRSALLRLALGFRGIDYKNSPFCPFYSLKNGGLGIDGDLRPTSGPYGYKTFYVPGYDITLRQNSFAQLSTSEMDPRFRAGLRRVLADGALEHEKFLVASFGKEYLKGAMLLWKPLFGSSTNPVSYRDYMAKVDDLLCEESRRRLDWSTGQSFNINPLAKKLFAKWCCGQEPKRTQLRRFSHRLEFFYDIVSEKDIELKFKGQRFIDLNSVRRSKSLPELSTPFIDKKGRCSVHA